MNRSVELSLGLTLPAAAALIVLATPIVQVLFQRGAMDALAALATAEALQAYALGLPAFVLIKAFAPGFFARADTATPVKIGILVVAVNLSLSLTLIQFLAHVGIALATSLAAWVNAGLLAFILWRRGQFFADRRLRRNLWRLVLASAVMTAALLGLEQVIHPEGSLLRLLALGGFVGVGLAVYFGMTALLGALKPMELLLRRRKA